MKPETSTINQHLSAADIARRISRSSPGVRKAIARLNIPPAIRAGRIPLYPAGTDSLVEESMRKANLKP